MKTPMQEMLEWIRATFPMDLDWPRMIEDKVESLLEKEKEVITDAYVVGEREWLMEYEGGRDAYTKRAAYKYYDETFNTKEK